MRLKFAICVIGTLIGCTGVPQESAPGAAAASSITRVSRPFVYEGYSRREFASFEQSSEYVSLSDGTRIATEVYLPEGYIGAGTEPAAYPTIFVLTPYMRLKVDTETGELVMRKSSRPDENVENFTAHGYAMVISDTRSFGASEGNGLGFGWRYQKDAGELVDWIAEQPWSDQNVGMVGGSHPGWTQIAAASNKPVALKAIAPAVIPMDGFTGQFFPGGIWLQGFLEGTGRSELYAQQFSDRNRNLVPAPVIDEDGDGELLDEIPLDLDSSGSFLDDYDEEQGPWPPQYPDDSRREHIYYHVFNGREDVPGPNWPAEPYIDAQAPGGESGRDIEVNMVPNVAESGVAIYNIAGWFDGFIRGSFEWYATLKDTNPSKIVIFPGYHNLIKGFMYDEYGVPVPDMRSEYLRFFDRYLKGIDNGIDREAPIYLYNMFGDGWRAENEWPLARQELAPYFLGPDQSISDGKAKQAGASSYTVDYGHDRRYGENLSGRWMGLGALEPIGSPVANAQDEKSLVFTGRPLTSDTEITGHPIIELFVSSSEAYGDFYVFLEDVDEQGTSLMVTEGQLRAGWKNLHDNDEMIDNSPLDVKPDLPWHGYEKDQWTDQALADGEIVKLTIDLAPTSWTVRRGHRIRIAIAGSNYPNYSLHPQLSPSNNPEAPDTIAPTIKVHWGAEHPSRVVLPIIPWSN
ncbi:MAG: CocE/NonD family hydrolase [Gammaproteobacteria bacterium]|nr:CocE/NonD family hydrolase [Gammaproteobacteria bacterium]